MIAAFLNPLIEFGLSVFYPLKQLTTFMAPLMCSSFPLRLRLPSLPSQLRFSSPPSQLRPPPDPPPCMSLHVPLEAPSPPEPPDPSDSPFHLIVLLSFDTSLTF
ncbi:hypothetical protein N665_0177s0020 [Sinapis alba]|nr:hypothetical protein N665_0177s0020 [Sinapis alba]